jgi:two-component system sensor histidine kinase CpxA
LLERKPQETATHLERIRDEVDVLEKLTSQVLALARAAQADPVVEDVGLSTVISRVAANAELEAGAKDVELLTVNPSEDYLVRANEMLLVSAVENVVRNAVQAAPAGGRVKIEVRHAGGQCVVAVSDNGQGLPESELENIFEPFHRLDTNQPGSGIGLAITARVIRQMGGQVSAQNAKQGGLIVSLAIPVQA